MMQIIIKEMFNEYMMASYNDKINSIWKNPPYHNDIR